MLLVHTTPQSKVVKFICVLFEEMLICYLATTHGMSIYIAYIIPVICTCFYHNHRFTHGVMLVSFVLMARFNCLQRIFSYNSVCINYGAEKIYSVLRLWPFDRIHNWFSHYSLYSTDVSETA